MPPKNINSKLLPSKLIKLPSNIDHSFAFVRTTITPDSSRMLILALFSFLFRPNNLRVEFAVPGACND